MSDVQQKSVNITIGADVFRFELDFNGMCKLEEIFSTDDHEVTFADVVAKLETGSVSAIRKFLWVTLLKHQPALKLEDVAAIAERAGGIVALSDRLQEIAGVKPGKGKARRAATVS